jgi:hypothetical protein
MGSRWGHAAVKHFALPTTKSSITLNPIVATISSSAPPDWIKGVAELGHLRNLNLDRDVPKREFLSNAWIHRAQAKCRCIDIAGALQGFHRSILRQSQLLQSE